MIQTLYAIAVDPDVNSKTAITTLTVGFFDPQKDSMHQPKSPTSSGVMYLNVNGVKTPVVVLKTDGIPEITAKIHTALAAVVQQPSFYS